VALKRKLELTICKHYVYVALLKELILTISYSPLSLILKFIIYLHYINLMSDVNDTKLKRSLIFK